MVKKGTPAEKGKWAVAWATIDTQLWTLHFTTRFTDFKIITSYYQKQQLIWRLFLQAWAAVMAHSGVKKLHFTHNCSSQICSKATG